MKRCNDCGFVKNLHEFYIHKDMYDGHLNKCKNCVKRRIKIYSQSPAGKLIEKKRNKNRKLSGYYNELCKKMRQKYPEKYIARQAVANALRSGKIKKYPCENCGNLNLEELEAHHPNYNQPLNIIWLCKRGTQNQCHLNVHFKFKNKYYDSQIPWTSSKREVLSRSN